MLIMRICCRRVLAWCVSLDHNLFGPIVSVVLLPIKACCSDASPQCLALAAHLRAGSTSQLASEGIECLARFGVSCALPNGGRREFSTVPCANTAFFDGHGRLVEHLVEHHAPLQTLLEPLQRDDLHPPAERMLVLFAGRVRCDEVRNSLGEIAVVLRPVAVDSFLDVSSLFGCATLALLLHCCTLGPRAAYDCQSQSDISSVRGRLGLDAWLPGPPRRGRRCLRARSHALPRAMPAQAP
jgi:hypothetical protein